MFVKEIRMKKQKVIKICVIAAVAAGCILLAAGWVHFAVLYSENQADESYISTDGEVERILRGILINNARFANGEDAAVTYDFDCPEYAELREKYDLGRLAGDGTEFEKGCRLMHAFSPRLAHGGSYGDDGIAMNSLELLEYSLDKPNHTINCRCKSQIFGEMCLSLGIYAKKVWIMPYSQLDDECHVVTEIYDSSYGKWIMLDFTNELYFTDENGTPLSVTEIREGLINGETMKYMSTESGSAEEIPEDDTTADRLYYLKNTAYFYTLTENGFGEQGACYYLVPEGASEEFTAAIVGENDRIISPGSFNAAPCFANE